jgi:hypothetical protein
MTERKPETRKMVAVTAILVGAAILLLIAVLNVGLRACGQALSPRPDRAGANPFQPSPWGATPGLAATGPLLVTVTQSRAASSAKGPSLDIEVFNSAALDVVVDPADRLRVYDPQAGAFLVDEPAAALFPLAIPAAGTVAVTVSATARPASLPDCIGSLGP